MISLDKRCHMMCHVKNYQRCSLRSKRFRASSSRTSGREQKKKGMTAEGEGKELTSSFPPLPSPSLFHLFVFRSRSNFRAITRLETLATQATNVVKVMSGQRTLTRGK